MSRGNSFVASKIRWRNFMSYGDNETTLDLTGGDLMVILGENLDKKSDDARNGAGKAQPLSAKLLTPDGFAAIGDASLGDIIVAANGKPSKVIGITDHNFEQPIYRIVTQDRRQTLATLDHAWDVLTDMRPPKNLNTYFAVDSGPLQWRTLTTREILDGLRSGHQFHLPLARPLKGPHSKAIEDAHNLGKLVAEHGLTNIHVPEDMNAEQRRMYLKGLLGYGKRGKGTALPTHYFRAVIENDDLATHIKETVWALGGYCRLGTAPRASYLEIRLPLHTGKSDPPTLAIIDVRKHSTAPTRCIMISDPSQLYVTDDYIVTHNSSIIDALCYVIFGKTLRGVPNTDLVHKFVPRKPMYVEFEFSKGEFDYMIERGERPSILRFYRKPKGNSDSFKKRVDRRLVYEISRGKTQTTAQICELLGYDLTLFEHLVANSTESDSFLELRPDKQRDVIEKLLGFEILSLKGKVISEQRKEDKKRLAVASATLETVREANRRIEQQISELQARADRWQADRQQQLGDLDTKITKLSGINYDQEIDNIKLLAEVETEAERITASVQSAKRDADAASRLLLGKQSQERTLLSNLERDEHTLKHMSEGVCPTCNQSWTPNKEEMAQVTARISETKQDQAALTEEIRNLQEEKDQAERTWTTAREEEQQFNAALDEMGHLEINFNTIEDAITAKEQVEVLHKRREELGAESNPHLPSVAALRDQALQPEDESEVRRLRKLIKHQDFLVKLLTDSDSFIRKQILDQWIPNINKRVSFYLRTFDLPHSILLKPDLKIVISLYGEEYALKSLSRGEQTNLNIAVRFAFQDIFEFVNYGLNLLLIDEFIDNGLGPGEARMVLETIKSISQHKGKSIILITHREDIAAQADRTLLVRKQNQDSWIEQIQ